MKLILYNFKCIHVLNSLCMVQKSSFSSGSGNLFIVSSCKIKNYFINLFHVTLLWERWNKHLLTVGKEVIKYKRNNTIIFQLGKTVSVLRWSPPQSVWVKVVEHTWLKVTCVTKNPFQRWWQCIIIGVLDLSAGSVGSSIGQSLPQWVWLMKIFSL